jgi:hypothetical protein
VLIQHGHFIFDSHQKLIEVENSLKDFKSSLILEAFKKIEEIKIATRIESEKGIMWITEGAYQSSTQEVTISNSTAGYLADSINSYRKEKGISEAVCDKLSIKESDIQSLILLYEQLNAAKNAPMNN